MKRKKTVNHNQLELALFPSPVHDEKSDSHPDVTAPTPMPQPTADEPAAAPAPPNGIPQQQSASNAVPVQDEPIQEPRLWSESGWTARVIRSEDDEGWAVAMTKSGESEPALIAPWTMGRDKKNPKPLDAAAFATLVKNASEVRRRHEQQLHALLHKSVSVDAGEGKFTVTLDIHPDEDSAHALLAARDETGALVAQVRVAPTFKLTKASAAAWIASDFRRPAK